MNKDFSKLALLGMATGLMALGQVGVEAAVDNNSVDIQHLMAKSKCSEHGCASLTAERDVRNSSQNQDADDEDEFEKEEEEAAPAAK